MLKTFDCHPRIIVKGPDSIRESELGKGPARIVPLIFQQTPHLGVRRVRERDLQIGFGNPLLGSERTNQPKQGPAEPGDKAKWQQTQEACQSVIPKRLQPMAEPNRVTHWVLSGLDAARRIMGWSNSRSFSSFSKATVTGKA